MASVRRHRKRESDVDTIFLYDSEYTENRHYFGNLPYCSNDGYTNNGAAQIDFRNMFEDVDYFSLDEDAEDVRRSFKI